MTRERLPSLPAAELEQHDRLGPFTAGSLTGGVGGAAVLALADRFVQHRGGGDLVMRAGAYVVHLSHAGSVSGSTQRALGFAGAVVAGAVVGGLFALVTRRLRKFGALFVWSLVFFPSLWILIHAFALPRIAPQLRNDLPPGLMLIAVLAYVVVFPFELPMRRRERPRWAGRLEDPDFEDADPSSSV